MKGQCLGQVWKAVGNSISGIQPGGEFSDWRLTNQLGGVFGLVGKEDFWELFSLRVRDQDTDPTIEFFRCQHRTLAKFKITEASLYAAINAGLSNYKSLI